MQTDFRSYLLSQINVGTRLYPLHLPQKPTYPAATYQVITANSLPTSNGLSAPKEWRVQIDAWGESYSQADTLAREIRAALDGYRGAAGSAFIQVSMLVNWMEMYEDGLDVYRVSQDYEITYTE